MRNRCIVELIENMLNFKIKNNNLLKLLTFFLITISFFIFLTTINTEAQNSFPRDIISVESKIKTYDFNVELALDDSHRQYGLMFRNFLPKMSGMLFIYDNKRDLNMWMKNTFISLDILFLDDDGTIINIAKSTEPKSLSIISSKHAAKAVLELNGGLTNELEIKVGDRIVHSSFENFDK